MRKKQKDVKRLAVSGKGRRRERDGGWKQQQQEMMRQQQQNASGEWEE